MKPSRDAARRVHKKRSDLREVRREFNFEYDPDVDLNGRDCRICGAEGGYCAHSGTSPDYAPGCDPHDPNYEGLETLDPDDGDLCVMCGEEREACGHKPRPLTRAEERRRQLRLKGTNLGGWADCGASAKQPCNDRSDHLSREVGVEELRRRVATKETAAWRAA